jgi:hypothetical protein
VTAGARPGAHSAEIWNTTGCGCAVEDHTDERLFRENPLESRRIQPFVNDLRSPVIEAHLPTLGVMGLMSPQVAPSHFACTMLVDVFVFPFSVTVVVTLVL